MGFTADRRVHLSAFGDSAASWPSRAPSVCSSPSPSYAAERNAADRVVPLAVARRRYRRPHRGPGCAPDPNPQRTPGPSPAETAQLGLAYRAGRHDIDSRGLSSQGQRGRSHGRSSVRRPGKFTPRSPSNGARLLIRLRSVGRSHHDRHHHDLDHHDAEYVRQPLHRDAPMT